MRRHIKLAGTAVGLIWGLFGLASNTLAQGPGAGNETPPTLPPPTAPVAVFKRMTVEANETPPTLSPRTALSHDSASAVFTKASATNLPASKLISELDAPKGFRGAPAAPAPARSIDLSFKLESLTSEAQAELTEGIRLAERHAFKAAVYHLDAAISFDGSSGLAYAWRAYALAETQAYDKALFDSNKAIELCPTELNYRQIRAGIYLRKKDYGRALADVDVVISKLPNKQVEPYILYILRAQVFEAMGNSRAVGDFEQALLLAPDNLTSLISLAWLYATSSDDSVRNGRRAIELATRACELTRWKNSQAIMALSVAHAESGDFVAAIRWHEKATFEGLRGTLNGFLIRSGYVLRSPYRYRTIAAEAEKGRRRFEAGFGWGFNDGICFALRFSAGIGVHIYRLPFGMIWIFPTEPL